MRPYTLRSLSLHLQSVAHPQQDASQEQQMGVHNDCKTNTHIKYLGSLSVIIYTIQHDSCNDQPTGRKQLIIKTMTPTETVESLLHSHSLISWAEDLIHPTPNGQGQSLQ